MKKLVLAISLVITSSVNIFSQNNNVNKQLVDHTIKIFESLVDSTIDKTQFDLFVNHLYTLTLERETIAQSVVFMPKNIEESDIISNNYYTPNKAIFNFLKNTKIDSLDIEISSSTDIYTTSKGKLINNLDTVYFTLFLDNIRTMYYVITIINKKIVSFDVVVYTV